MTCLACRGTTQIRTNVCPGYFGGTFMVYQCETCHSQMINPQVITNEYERVYGESQDGSGYQRYAEYAAKIKAQSDPLVFLAATEMVYFPVWQYLRGKKAPLDVLEVGCGYGYLTHAVRTQGHNCIGIDISAAAIEAAQKSFGGEFITADINTFTTDKKFDLIVATEVIEHLVDPLGFIESLKSLLQPQGVIIITTPNRNYYPFKSTWQTELPPIHFSWLSEAGMALVGSRAGLSTVLVNFAPWARQSAFNHLTDYLLTRSATVPTNKSDATTVAHKNVPAKLLHYLLVDLKPTRWLANVAYCLLVNRYQIMGVVLSRSS